MKALLIDPEHRSIEAIEIVDRQHRAGDAEAAQQAADQHARGLVLLDEVHHVIAGLEQRLPELGGRERPPAIRRAERRPRLFRGALRVGELAAPVVRLGFKRAQLRDRLIARAAADGELRRALPRGARVTARLTRLRCSAGGGRLVSAGSP